MNPRIGLLCSRVRVEERLLWDELGRRAVERVRLDDAAWAAELGAPPPALDLVLDRGLSFGRSRALLEILEQGGLRCVNSSATVRVCGDKLRTHLALLQAGVPAPRTALAFTPEAALAALEQLGYPAVLKPVVGSWGRLVARLNDRHAAEAVLEDRQVLGDWQHHAYYLQELVAKPGRDIRAFVIGGRTVCAVYRHSAHWITNTARGGRTSNCPVAGEVGRLAEAAAAAVGGEIVAVDLVECPDGRLLVLEVNHSMEFRNSIEVTGVDITARIVDHALAAVA